MEKVVERYLAHLGNKDWDGLATTLSPSGFERIGPFCDRVAGKTGYVRFLRDAVSALGSYRVEARRISESDGVVFAEIDESFVLDGAGISFPEVLVFDVDRNELINKVQVFMMNPNGKPVVPAGKAATTGMELEQ